MLNAVAKAAQGAGTALIIDMPGSLAARARQQLNGKMVRLRPTAATIHHPDLLCDMGFNEGCQPGGCFTQGWLPGNQELNLLPRQFCRPGQLPRKGGAQLKVRRIDEELSGIRKLDWLHISDVGWHATLQALEGATRLIRQHQCLVSIDLRTKVAKSEKAERQDIEQFAAQWNMPILWLTPHFLVAGPQKSLSFLQVVADSNARELASLTEYSFDELACLGFREVEHDEDIAWRWSTEESAKFWLPLPVVKDNKVATKLEITIFCFRSELSFHCFANGRAAAAVIGEDEVTIVMDNDTAVGSLIMDFSFLNYSRHGTLGIAPHAVRVSSRAK